MWTVRFWPSRQMRAMACRSLAGFQSMSYITRREAPIKFRPTPPALELSRKIPARSKDSGTGIGFLFLSIMNVSGRFFERLGKCSVFFLVFAK